MLIHPQFDPVAFSLGPLAVRWYGLMYLAGFFCFWLLGRRRSSEPWRGISGEDLENLLFYGIFGVILGGRLGYCLSISLSSTCRIPCRSCMSGREA